MDGAQNTTRRVLAVLRPSWGRVGLLLASAAVAAALTAAPALAYQRIIDVGVGRGNLPAIIVYSGAALAALIAAALVQWSGQWLAVTISNGLGHRLRTDLFRHVQRLDIDFHVARPTGDLLSRMNSDVQAAQGIVSSLIVSVLSNIIRLALVIATMSWFSWQLIGLALVAPALAVPVTRHTARVIKRLGEQRQQSLAAVTNFLVDRLAVDAVTVAALHDGTKRDGARFSGLSELVRRHTVRIACTSGAFQTLLTCFTGLSVALVYLVGGVLVVQGRMSLGMLVGFISLLPSLHGPLTNIVNARVEVVGALVSFRRIFEVMDESAAVATSPDARPLPNAPTALSLDGVSYAHPRACSTSWRLHDVSFTLHRGRVVALVGPSGSGKSTIGQLCARLRDPVAGRMAIDGRPLDAIPDADRTGHIGVLSQDSYLFHESIAHNLRYARPDATPEQMTAALRAAGIWEPLVERLPEGLDTVVGDRGSRLSGGERQRLAIARLLLRRPAFVVLDEATASLDAETARTVMDTVLELFRDCGILLVTHDLSLAGVADEIIVLNDGRIVERGAPDVLATYGVLRPSTRSPQSVGAP